jgi:hypothetical protein
MALLHSPRIVTDGLVLCLDAANRESYPGSGTVWTDLAGSNNGTLTNGPTFSSANGGSIVFDGVDDYVLCSRQTSFANTSQLSLCAWMKRRLSNSIVIIAQAESLSNDVSFELWNDGNVYFEVGNGSNSYGFTTNTSTSWQYLCMVFNGSLTGNSNRLRAFINGVQLTLTYNGNIPATTNTVNENFNIGAYLPNNNYSDGNIAVVQVYNRALTPAEVLQNYNATKSRFRV